ncbi:short chain dehydrogenase [Erythrobacter sp. Dej080120_24]|uniref:SDR family oxidoreductase n=1 Tax=Erythrobacter sp. Dej080120_24 TaxID=3024837 RepID=UPI0004D37751|nr:short-chain dehydrogenase [Erythrobacter sp. JL475]BDW83439.1 short chain dehydrogenase [Erythrobacter sp. Dej080120_24]
MDFGLAGRVAIVTGGTRGLGRAISTALAQQGCVVIACARSEPESLPEGVEFAALDVRDPDAVAEFVETVAARHGRLDIIVNNAGGSPPSDAATASPRFAEAITRLNLLAPYYLSRAAFPHLEKSPGAAIVNIASVSGIRPSPGTSIYGAAKAGLLSLTKSLAQEWGPKSIRVNAIIVGLAETETSADTYGSEATRAKVGQSLPLGRMATGDDVARAVLYLVSDASEYVSGAWLNVDGGGERPLFLDIVKGG